jgi:hypothetical protein
MPRQLILIAYFSYVLAGCGVSSKLPADDSVEVDFAAIWEKNAIQDGISAETAKKAGDCLRKRIERQQAATGKQVLSRNEAMPFIIECINEATD